MLNWLVWCRNPALLLPLLSSFIWNSVMGESEIGGREVECGTRRMVIVSLFSFVSVPLFFCYVFFSVSQKAHDDVFFPLSFLPASFSSK